MRSQECSGGGLKMGPGGGPKRVGGGGPFPGILHVTDTDTDDTDDKPHTKEPF